MIDTRFEIIVFNYFCKRLKIDLHYYYYFYYYTQKLNKQSTLPIGSQRQDNDCNSRFLYWVHICFEMSFSYNGQNLLVYCMACFQCCFPHTASHLHMMRGCHIGAYGSESLHRSSYHKLSKSPKVPNVHHTMTKFTTLLRLTLPKQNYQHCKRLWFDFINMGPWLGFLWRFKRMAPQVWKKWRPGISPNFHHVKTEYWRPA